MAEENNEALDKAMDEIDKMKKRISKSLSTHDHPQIIVAAMMDIINFLITRNGEADKQIGAHFVIGESAVIAQACGLSIEQVVETIVTIYNEESA